MATAASLAPIFGGLPVDRPMFTPRRANVPWVEKYRPSRIDQVAYQTEVVAALKGCLNGVDLPHMLFYGPPGTGKTTCAMALCRQLFRDADAYDDRVLELNASDERGIGIVRTRIKEFAQRLVRTTATRKCAASVKIVILDEADAMTSAAQMALRRIMETESRTTRFFIICNYVSRIIAPLASRCVKYRFKPLPVNAQIERLQYIVNIEKPDTSSEVLQKLVEYSDGDLRKSITRLQSLCMGAGAEDIRLESVDDCCGWVDIRVVKRFIAACREPKLANVEVELAAFLASGFSSTQLLRQIAPHIVDEDDLSGVKRAHVLMLIAEIEEKLLDGASTYIQLGHLAVFLHRTFHA